MMRRVEMPWNGRHWFGDTGGHPTGEAVADGSLPALLGLGYLFSRIGREIGTAGELLHGLPTDAAWLVALIYGGFNGKEPNTHQMQAGHGCRTQLSVLKLDGVDDGLCPLA